MSDFWLGFSFVWFLISFFTAWLVYEHENTLESGMQMQDWGDFVVTVMFWWIVLPAAIAQLSRSPEIPGPPRMFEFIKSIFK